MKIKKNRVVNPMTRITYDKLTKEEVVELGAVVWSHRAVY